MRTNWSSATVLAAAILLSPAVARAQNPAQAGAPAAAAASAEASVGTAIADHALSGAAESFPKGTAKLYCFSKVTGADTTSGIEHVWYKGDTEVGRVKLKVGGSRRRGGCGGAISRQGLHDRRRAQKAQARSPTPRHRITAPGRLSPRSWHSRGDAKAFPGAAS